MKFSRLDLLKLFDKATVDRIMSALSQKRYLTRVYKGVYLPDVKNGQCLKHIVVYDLEQVISYYKMSIDNPNHRHIAHHSLRYLKMMNRLKESL